jgi:PAS domain S-box-containing protein
MAERVPLENRHGSRLDFWFERLRATEQPLASAGAGLVIMVVVVALSLLIEPITDPFPFLLIYPAMVFVGFLCGWVGGLVAIAVTLPAGLYFFLPIGEDWGFGGEDDGRFIGLLLMLTGLTAVGAVLRRRELERLSVIEREREARHSIERSERRLSTLAAVSERLATAGTTNGILESVTALTTPVIADWSVAGIQSNGDPEPLVSVSATAAPVEARLRQELADPGSYLRRLLSDARARPAESEPVTRPLATDAVCEEIDTSLVAAPIAIDGTAIGAVVFGMESSDRTFDGGDCRFVHDLARRVSASIANTRLSGAVQEELRERSRAETAFRESEGRFRTLANAGTVLIRQEDEGGDAMYFNQPWFAFTGRALERLVGERWLDTVHPADRERVRATLQRARGSREFMTVEYRLHRHDGEYCWMIERGAPNFTDSGEFTGLISSIIDITDRKRAEADLQLLASTGAVITSSLDLDEMLIRFANHVTEEFADWCVIHLLRDDVLTPAALATSQPGDRSRLTDAVNHSVRAVNESGVIRELLRTRQPVLKADDVAASTAELVGPQIADDLCQGAGMTSWIITPLEARGRVIGTFFLATAGSHPRFDRQNLIIARSLGRRVAVVVENAQLFAEAQAAENRYRRLFEGTADAILVIDQSGRAREVNPALLNLVGVRADQIIGEPFANLLQMPRETVEEILRTAVAGDWRGELQLAREDQAPIPVEAWLSPLLVPEGPIIVAAIRDISERHRFEESRRRLLATVSHDLKNPLNSIKANAQLAQRQLKRGSVAPEKMASMFERIDGLTNRMVAQIEDLMDVALLEAGSDLELHLSDVDLVALTRVVVDQYQATTDQHRIIIQAPEERIAGHWDPHRLERVLANLLTNAIKYSPDGGAITFRIARGTSADGRECAVLSLSDEGIGIQADDLPHLFKQIGRGRNVTERFSGTGIGLVGVSRILQQHGGTISVESAEGKGSTFTIRLPLGDAPAAESPEPVEPTP